MKKLVGFPLGFPRQDRWLPTEASSQNETRGTHYVHSMFFELKCQGIETSGFSLNAIRHVLAWRRCPIACLDARSGQCHQYRVDGVSQRGNTMNTLLSPSPFRQVNCNRPATCWPSTAACRPKPPPRLPSSAGSTRSSRSFSSLSCIDSTRRKRGFRSSASTTSASGRLVRLVRHVNLRARAELRAPLPRVKLLREAMVACRGCLATPFCLLSRCGRPCSFSRDQQ